MDTTDLRAALIARKAEIEQMRAGELLRLQQQADQALAPYVAAAGEIDRMLHLLDHADEAIPALEDILVPTEGA